MYLNDIVMLYPLRITCTIYGPSWACSQDQACRWNGIGASPRKNTLTIWDMQFNLANLRLYRNKPMQYTWNVPIMIENKAFLGLHKIFWQFLPKFLRQAAPLHCKLEKDQPYHFELLNKTNHLTGNAVTATDVTSNTDTTDTGPKLDGWFYAFEKQFQCILLYDHRKEPAKTVGLLVTVAEHSWTGIWRNP